jgi:hypothetical protein
MTFAVSIGAAGVAYIDGQGSSRTASRRGYTRTSGTVTLAPQVGLGTALGGPAFAGSPLMPSGNRLPWAREKFGCEGCNEVGCTVFYDPDGYWLYDLRTGSSTGVAGRLPALWGSYLEHLSGLDAGRITSCFASDFVSQIGLLMRQRPTGSLIAPHWPGGCCTSGCAVEQARVAGPILCRVLQSVAYCGRPAGR